MIPAVAAMLIGLWGITTPSFWRDESVSTLAAAMPIGDLWHLLDSIDRVHALYYLLLRPVAALSTGELAMRLPSVVATAAAAYGIAVLGRKLATPGAGLLAASLYVVLPMVSRYAQEVRSYAIVTAVAVLATWVLIEATRRSSRRWYLAYGACLVLLGWFHVYALLLVVAHVVTVLWGRASSSSLSSPSSRPDVVRFAGALAVAGAGIAPLALLAAGQRETQLSWLKPPKPSDLPGSGSRSRATCGWHCSWSPSWSSGRSPGAADGGRAALGAAAVRVHGDLPGPSGLQPEVRALRRPRHDAARRRGPERPAAPGAGLDRAGPRRGADRPDAPDDPRAGHAADNLRDMAATLLARQRPGDAVLYVDEYRRLFSAVYEDAYRNLRDLTYAPDRRTPRTAAQLTAALDGVERVWLVTGGRKHMNRAFVEDDERYLALMANRDFALRSTDDFGYSWIGLYVRKRR